MDATASAVEAVDASKEGLWSLLADLISFRTETQAKEATHFPEEARRCVAFVAEFLSDLDFTVETWDVGPSATFDAHPVIVAKLAGSGGGRSVAFNGHLDVVPVGDTSAWTQEPFGGTLHDGRIYGRGATDMKGGIAAALWATKARSRYHDVGLHRIPWARRDSEGLRGRLRPCLVRGEGYSRPHPGTGKARALSHRGRAHQRRRTPAGRKGVRALPAAMVYLVRPLVTFDPKQPQLEAALAAATRPCGLVPGWKPAGTQAGAANQPAAERPG